MTRNLVDQYHCDPECRDRMGILHCMWLVVRVMWTLCSTLLVKSGAVNHVRTMLVIVHCTWLVEKGI